MRGAITATAVAAGMFASVGAVTAGTAPPAAAATAPPAGANPPPAVFGMRPSAQTAGPVGAPNVHFNYTVAPGGTVAGAVVVSNLTDQALQLAMYGADLVPLGGSGGFTVAQPGQTMRSVGAWTRVQPTVSLAPRQETTVPFIVDVPQDAPPGDYGGAVVAQNAPQGAGGIAVQTRVALEVVLRVPGTTVLGARLGPLQTHRYGSGYVMSALLRNTGTEGFRFDGRVLLQQGGSVLLVSAPMSPRRALLLPGQQVRLSARWDHPPRFGSVAAHAAVQALPADGNGQTFTDRAVTLTFFPWLLVLLALLAFVLLTAVARQTWRRAEERWRERRHQRRRGARPVFAP